MKGFEGRQPGGPGEDIQLHSESCRRGKSDPGLFGELGPAGATVMIRPVDDGSGGFNPDTDDAAEASLDTQMSRRSAVVAEL